MSDLKEDDVMCRIDKMFKYLLTQWIRSIDRCCWWGRGVIQTTGVCNYGKLNYYLGKAAADEGRDSRYPDIVSKNAKSTKGKPLKC